MNVFETILGHQSFSERPAVIGSESLSHGELRAAAEELGALIGRMAASSRPIVAVCLPSSGAYISTFLATYIADGVVVPINPTAASNEIRHVLEDSGADCLITELKPALVDAFAQIHGVKTWRDVRVYGLNRKSQKYPQPGDRVIFYTSGSTGRPKGVVMTDDGVTNNIAAVANALALSPGDATLVFTPTGYTFAFSQTFTHLWAGGAVLPWRHGLMYPARMLKAATAAAVTGMTVNPTTLRMLGLNDQFASKPMTRVRYLMIGGQPLYSKLARLVGRLVPNARVTNVYGCTENSPRISHYWLPADISDRETPWPVGPALHGTEVRIADDDGSPVGSGLPGEILVRGNSLMRGYWGAPELTRTKVVDGWFHTGDTGFVDSDGNINLIGRMDNIFVVGHEKVAAEEVEAVIEQVDGVSEVAVDSVVDELLDRVPVALVAVEDDQRAVLDSVISTCQEKLSGAKVPRRLFMVKSVPKTPYGKINRPEVRKEIARLNSDGESE